MPLQTLLYTLLLLAAPTLVHSSPFHLDGSLQHGSMFLLLILCAVGILALIIAAICSILIYKGMDPVNYFAVLWMITEVWDFYSDVIFAIYLYTDGRLLIFGFSATFLIIPYLSNLLYLISNIRLWSSGLAPGAVRKWLGYWSWWLVIITILTGGVHASVELANSALFPMGPFCMHLTYNEIIRVRAERFVSNVILENIPQLLVQITYLAISNDAPGFVIYATLGSTIAGILFSGAYFFSSVNRHIPTQPIASFTTIMLVEDWPSYLCEAHWNLKTAFQKSFKYRDPEFILIDDVIELVNEVKIYGRVLRDEHYDVPIRADSELLHNLSIAVKKACCLPSEIDLQISIDVREITADKHNSEFGIDPAKQVFKSLVNILRCGKKNRVFGVPVPLSEAIVSPGGSTTNLSQHLPSTSYFSSVGTPPPVRIKAASSLSLSKADRCAGLVASNISPLAPVSEGKQWEIPPGTPIDSIEAAASTSPPPQQRTSTRSEAPSVSNSHSQTTLLNHMSSSASIQLVSQISPRSPGPPTDDETAPSISTPKQQPSQSSMILPPLTQSLTQQQPQAPQPQPQQQMQQMQPQQMQQNRMNPDHKLKIRWPPTQPTQPSDYNRSRQGSCTPTGKTRTVGRQLRPRNVRITPRTPPPNRKRLPSLPTKPLPEWPPIDPHKPLPALNKPQS